MIRKLSTILLLTAFVPLAGCSNSSNSNSSSNDISKESQEKEIVVAKPINPCELSADKPNENLSESTSEDSLRGIRSHTSKKVVLMPVTNANSGGGAYGMPQMNSMGQITPDLTGFATEIMNQSFRNEGLKTIAWFKVSKKLKEVMKANNSDTTSIYGAYMPAGGGNFQVNDENINELITAAKQLGACYVVRPVILKNSTNSKTSTSANPLGVMVFGGAAVRTKTENNAEVDLKIDIINTYEEDIIASKTFSGRSVLVGKERANVLDGITGSQIFSAGSTADQSRIAFYDTIDKIVEFLDDKME